MLASMLSPTDSLCSSGGGIDGGSDGDSNLLQYEDGNSDESSEYQVWSDSAVSLRFSSDESSPKSSG
ncbi:hypothetical protein Tco_0643481 [Tanacetum coccineum]